MVRFALQLDGRDMQTPLKAIIILIAVHCFLPVAYSLGLNGCYKRYEKQQSIDVPDYLRANYAKF